MSVRARACIALMFMRGIGVHLSRGVHRAARVLSC